MSKRQKLRKLAFWTVLLLVSSLILFCLSGKSLTAEMAFRKYEQKNLLGPAQILGRESIRCNSYNHMIIGKSEYGYTIFAWHKEDLWDDSPQFRYFPKQEDVTLFTPVDVGIYHDYEDSWCPIMLFCESPEATKAVLTIDMTYEGEEYYNKFGSQISSNGYFLFRLTQDQISADEIMRLSIFLSPDYVVDGSLEITVDLYDRSGNLLGTYHPTLNAN